jgi:hypothetical protein
MHSCRKCIRMNYVMFVPVARLISETTYRISMNIGIYVYIKPVTVAQRSSLAKKLGIVGSNPTQGMDFWYVCLLCLCCPVFR